ncbi:DUF4439 domain-containing protein [Arthrobacter sp. YAF34]|uniref:DUF4439 domain-containing protein n=1 Tax=Arthrobacter sp. YAF34 TaxID=3233083 RepID=UPI003F93F33F
MNDEPREKRWQDNFPRMLPRYALLACLALVVVSLGVALRPAQPPKPAAPPFSEQARSAALAETVRLKDAASHLGTPGKDRPADHPAGAAGSAVERTVTLLTTQAQALLAPGQSSPATPAPSAVGSSAAPAAGPVTAAGLVPALANSGRQRLADAAVADGGMARLLAAVGTAQLLQASALAAATGTAPPTADVTAPQLSGTCPSAAAGSGQDATVAPEAAGDSGAASPGATVGNALAAVVRTEAQTIYGYQVALPRLSGDDAKVAAAQLARHEALLRNAESLSRLNCSAIPPREAGYTLSQSFLASPATGLGSLEAAALPAYGDLVALSGGKTRQWAVAALLESGKHTVLWGADPGALPGLDKASMPTLAPSPAPLPSE